MLIGYARISKADGSQSLDLQRDALREAGVSDDAIYEDQASGQREDRPGLAAFLKAARQGDVIVVWRLDRTSFIPAGKARKRTTTAVLRGGRKGTGLGSPFPSSRMIPDRAAPSRVRFAASRPGPLRADLGRPAYYEGKGGFLAVRTGRKGTFRPYPPPDPHWEATWSTSPATIPASGIAS